MAEGDSNSRSRTLPLAEVARLLRRSRGYLAVALAEGMPATSMRGARGTPEWRIDPGRAAHWLEARAVAAARSELEAKHAQEVARLGKALEQASGDTSDPLSRGEALRRRTVAEMRLREIDLAERERSVMPCDEINRVLATLLTIVRDRMLALPTRLAPELAGDATIEGCGRLVHDAIHEALTEIADLGDEAEELLERGEERLPAELDAKLSRSPRPPTRREPLADSEDNDEPEGAE